MIDPNATATSASKLLAVVKDTPLWLLVGVSLALGALGYLPPFTPLVPPAALAWVRYMAVATAIIAVCRAVALLIGMVAALLPRGRAPPSLHVSPNEAQCVWGSARQPDGKVATQISVHGLVKNLTDAPLGLVAARLIKPRIRGRVLNSLVFVREEDSPYYGTAHVSQHLIPPRTILPVSIELMIGGTPARTGELPAVVGITDDEGREFRVRVTLRCIDSPKGSP